MEDHATKGRSVQRAASKVPKPGYPARCASEGLQACTASSVAAFAVLDPRRRLCLAAILACVAIGGLAPLLAGTGPGEIFLDVSGLRALQATLQDSAHRADLRARSRVLALRAVWGGLEADPSESCAPFGDEPGATPEQYRLRFDFAPLRSRSSRVYRAEYTCCRIDAQSYISKLSASGFRGGAAPTTPMLTDAESIDILHAALDQEITRVPLFDLAATDDGIRYVEIRRTECLPAAATLEYLLVAAPRPLDKWSADTPILAFSATYEPDSGEIRFAQIEGAALHEQRDG